MFTWLLLPAPSPEMATDFIFAWYRLPFDLWRNLLDGNHAR